MKAKRAWLHTAARPPAALAQFRRWLLLVGFVLAQAIAGGDVTGSIAGHSSKLYIGHSARLTAQIPADWHVDPIGTFDYVGSDGFLRSEPVTGQAIGEACSGFAESNTFDARALVTAATWAGRSACRVSGHIKGVRAEALVVPHPYPFATLWGGDRYAFAALVADPSHFDAILATLDFSPDNVSPEAFVLSVIEIMQARAYWSTSVDWSIVRQEALASVDGLTTLDHAQGALQNIVASLHAAGDNHSYVLLAGQPNRLVESSGFGLLVGGQQVLAVFPGGPADRAGVRVGDILESVDNQPFPLTSAPIDPAPVLQLSAPSALLTLRRPGLEDAVTVAIEPGQYSRYLPPSGRRLANDIGYIQVPHFLTPGRETDFAVTGNGIFESVDQSPTCGWIVDLRLDGGGSYSPMITAVGPILGDGQFVGWRWRDGRQHWVTYEDGRILDDGDEVSDYLGHETYDLQRPNPPVAVLIGPVTTSSGEVTALAFVGRNQTRFFGEPTGGYTTANLGYLLFDGSDLALAEAAMTDRNGVTYLDGIEPDEFVRNNWTEFGTESDQVLNAAVEWLRAQPECAGAEMSRAA